LTSLDESSQGSLRAYEIVLSDDLIEGRGSQQFGEGRCGAQALARGVVKE
jgi:hypothetical protein